MTNQQTTGQIVLAYSPSNSLKDWSLYADGDHHWYYEQATRFYCPTHKRYGASEAGSLDGHPRDVGREPYYNLVTGEITAPPRLYITHYPKKGEWEHLKTVGDLKQSPLYLGGNI